MDAGDGLTAEQLRARIEEQRALQATLTAQGEDALREIGEAEERQRLRRQLDVEETRSSHLGAVLYSRQRRRRSIDRDEAGALPSEESTFAKPKPQPTPGALAKTTTSYASNVVKRDFVWEVSGLSWLEQQLAQEGRECTSSDIFHVHPNDSDSKYVLVYSPRGASLLHADANVCDESSDWDICEDPPAHRAPSLGRPAPRPDSSCLCLLRLQTSFATFSSLTRISAERSRSCAAQTASGRTSATASSCGTRAETFGRGARRPRWPEMARDGLLWASVAIPISPHLPAPPHTSPHLPVSPSPQARRVAVPARDHVACFVGEPRCGADADQMRIRCRSDAASDADQMQHQMQTRCSIRCSTR